MDMMENPQIFSVPLESYVNEAASQKDRVLGEVMQLLFDAMPDDLKKKQDFTLSDGTKCYVKKFYGPHENFNGEQAYGFDVVFKNHPALNHLEFTVTCTGMGRKLSAPH